MKIGDIYYFDERFGKIKRALGISNPFIETFPKVEIVEIKGKWVKYRHCTGICSSSSISDFKKFYQPIDTSVDFQILSVPQGTQTNS